jgi:hypothetical protein
MLRALFRLIEIFIFQKHDSNCQIQNEERTNDDTKQKVESNEPALISININV